MVLILAISGISRPGILIAQSKVGVARWQPLSHHEGEQPVIQSVSEKHRDLPVVEVRFVEAESWSLAMLKLRPQREQMEGAKRMRLWLRAMDESSVGRTMEFSVKTTDGQRRWQYPRLTVEWMAVDVALDPELIENLDVTTLGLPKNDRSLNLRIAGPVFDQNAAEPPHQPRAEPPNVPPRQRVDPATLPMYGRWRSSRIGGGGWIQRVVPTTTDPQRFYAYVDISGLYRSDDGGQTWRMLHMNLPHGHVRSVSVDPRNADVILAAVGKRTWGQGVYRSTNGGATWARVLQAEFHGNDTPVARAAGVVLARHPVHPDIVLAASRNDGLFRSDDGGLTWRSVGVTGQIPQDVLFDHADPDRAWVCTLSDPKWNKEGGLYRSEDSGRTWQKILSTSPGEIVQDPVHDEVLYGLWDESRIERSLDGGMTWSAWSDGLPLNQEAARSNPINQHRFLVLAAGPDFILTASTRGDLYRLKAGESTWQLIEPVAVDQGDWPLSRPRTRPGEFDFLGASLSSLTVSPHDADHWFWTDWFGIYQTRDAGRTWRLSVEGIECTVVHDLILDPRQPGLVHIGVADIGYLRSTDGGLTFDRGYLPIRSGNNIRMVAAPAVSDRLYAVGSGGSGWTSDTLFLSDDLGRTWRRTAMRGYPPDSARCVAVAVHPKQPRVVAITASGEVGPERGGVYISEDSGETLRWIGQGLPEGQAVFKHEIWGGGRHLLMLEDGSMIALHRDRPELFVRVAGTDTWQSVTPADDGQPLSLLPDPNNPEGVFLTMQDRAFLYSDDRGVTWRILTEGRVAAAAVSSDGGTFAVLLRDATLRISTDRGRTWHECDTDSGSLPLGPAMQLSEAGRLIAGSDGNGAFWLDLQECP